MPERSGIEMFAEDKFSATFKKYDTALNKAERQATTTARTITKSGKSISAGWGSGIENLLGRMNALDIEMETTRGQARSLLAEMDAAPTSIGGVASALGIAGATVAAVALGVGLAGKKLLDALAPWTERAPVLIEAQERLNEQWDKTATILSQTAAPAMAAWINLKVQAMEALTPLLEGLRDFAAYVHIGAASLTELVRGVADAEGRQEIWNRISEKSLDIWDDYHQDLVDVAETVETKKFVPDVEPGWKKVADVVQSTLDRIDKLQESHLLRLQRQEEDAARRRARAWTSYEKQVAKAVKSGAKRLEKLEAKYEKDRVKTITEYQERITETEEDIYKDRAKAREDFERQARQARERFQLSQLQSERRYQFERNRLVAEGDTLAIEQLDERYKLEQKEAVENESLRERQDREGQAAQIREAGEAAREQLREMEQQLGQQLAEQEANYREQIEQQRQANQERLGEMAVDFAERQRLEDENRSLAAQRQEEDYRRQLGELGENLADQLREQDIHYGYVAALLEQYYGAAGELDTILAGFHSRELERIGVTAEAMAMMTQIPTPTFPATRTPSYHPVYGMQRGGIVQGPATFHVEAGLREAVIPLGGTMQHNFGPLNVNVGGLEGASPTDVNAIAKSLAMEMTHQVRAMRRS